MYGFREYRFCQEWGDPAMIFTLDEVTRDEVNDWKSLPNRLTREKTGIHGSPCIILFLTRYLCPDGVKKPAKTIIDC